MGAAILNVGARHGGSSGKKGKGKEELLLDPIDSLKFRNKVGRVATALGPYSKCILLSYVSSFVFALAEKERHNAKSRSKLPITNANKASYRAKAARAMELFRTFVRWIGLSQAQREAGRLLQSRPLGISAARVRG